MFINAADQDLQAMKTQVLQYLFLYPIQFITYLIVKISYRDTNTVRYYCSTRKRLTPT